MDLILFIIEVVVWIVDIVGVFADVYAWTQGRENRIERRVTRKEGADIPVRDKWNRRFIALTVIVIALTLGLLLWKLPA